MSGIYSFLFLYRRRLLKVQQLQGRTVTNRDMAGISTNQRGYRSPMAAAAQFRDGVAECPRSCGFASKIYNDVFPQNYTGRHRCRLLGKVFSFDSAEKYISSCLVILHSSFRNPRSCLYSIGLSPAKDSLMRFRLYQLIWPGRTAPRKKISVEKKCELLQMANIGSMVVAVFFNDRMPRAPYQFFLASIYQCETFCLILRPFVA